METVFSKEHDQTTLNITFQCRYLEIEIIADDCDLLRCIIIIIVHTIF